MSSGSLTTWVYEVDSVDIGRPVVLGHGGFDGRRACKWQSPPVSNNRGCPACAFHRAFLRAHNRRRTVDAQSTLGSIGDGVGVQELMTIIRSVVLCEIYRGLHDHTRGVLSLWQSVGTMPVSESR